MWFLKSMDVAASAMTAERLRLDVIANNIANAQTTRTPEGGPYRRQFVVFAPRSSEGDLPGAAGQRDTNGNGVKVAGIFRDQAAPKLVYNPGHPDADANGYVAMPNIDTVTEMVDMISASRAYEANVTAINEMKQMVMRTLDLLRG
jgi:flagellar basal-body rod protein FlgC